MFDVAIPIQLIPSKRLAVLSAVIHGGGLVCVWFSGLAWPFAVLGSLMALFSHYRHVQQQKYIDRHPLNHAVLNYEQFHLRNGDIGYATAHCIAHRWAIVLRLNTVRNYKYTLIILPDAMPTSEFRRLRVRLRHPFYSKIKDKDI
jgi:hypothetical protein